MVLDKYWFNTGMKTESRDEMKQNENTEYILQYMHTISV